MGSESFYLKMNDITDSALIEGNRCRLLTNGEQAFPEMLKAIDGAKTRVYCETYILRLDKTGKQFVAALERAAARGLEVRLIFDAFGSRGLEPTDLKGLIDAGGMIRVFNPRDTWTVVRINNRDHRKILVVDGRQAFLGGLNLADEYGGNGVTKGFWRDTALHVTGPVALEAETVFVQSWNQGGRDYLGKDLPIVGVSQMKKAIDEPLMKLMGKEAPFDGNGGDVVKPLDGGVKARVVWSAPDRIASRILDMYLLAINSAKERIYITNGYFVPPLILSRALIEAARRGVDVRLILQGETDEPTVRTVSIGYYGKFLEEGVHIYEWQPSLLHAKTMVVDGKWLTVGSANLDGRALFLNYEANLAVSDKQTCKQMEEQFMLDLKSCREVSLEYWEKRSMKQKASEVLLIPIEGQL
ncbi:MAG: hypothetical protein JXR97_10225 [Planctomycetes bacterium]|nr:hypothetical protein [Planctomycetota bacterium]